MNLYSNKKGGNTIKKYLEVNDKSEYKEYRENWNTLINIVIMKKKNSNNPLLESITELEDFEIEININEILQFRKYYRNKKKEILNNKNIKDKKKQNIIIILSIIDNTLLSLEEKGGFSYQ